MAKVCLLRPLVVRRPNRWITLDAEGASGNCRTPKTTQPRSTIKQRLTHSPERRGAHGSQTQAGGCCGTGPLDWLNRIGLVKSRFEQSYVFPEDFWRKYGHFDMIFPSDVEVVRKGEADSKYWYLYNLGIIPLQFPLLSPFP
jgi:hypothetical protein